MTTMVLAKRTNPPVPEAESENVSFFARIFRSSNSRTPIIIRSIYLCQCQCHPTSTLLCRHLGAVLGRGLIKLSTLLLQIHQVLVLRVDLLEVSAKCQL